MSEYLIQVDEKDNEVGSVERLKAHLGDGILHRGLVVVVKNQEDQILLTQRSMVRPDLPFPAPFPGFWDVTIAGHPRWGQHDYLAPMGNELREELGIKAKNGEMNYLGKFQYYAPDPTYPNPQSASTFRLSEREICGVGLLHTSDDPVINPVELASSRWVESKELAKTLSSLKMAPWASIVLTRFPGIA
jgi:isopentenyl-diphosphate delta-isomerase